MGKKNNNNNGNSSSNKSENRENLTGQTTQGSSSESMAQNSEFKTPESHPSSFGGDEFSSLNEELSRESILDDSDKQFLSALSGSPEELDAYISTLDAERRLIEQQALEARMKAEAALSEADNKNPKSPVQNRTPFVSRGKATTFLESDSIAPSREAGVDEVIKLASKFEAGSVIDSMDINEYSEVLDAFNWTSIQHPLISAADSKGLKDWREKIDKRWAIGAEERVKRVDFPKQYDTVSTTHFSDSVSNKLFITDFKKGYFSVCLKDMELASIQTFFNQLLEVKPEYTKLVMTLLLNPIAIFDSFMNFVNGNLSQKQIETMKDGSRILNFTNILTHFQNTLVIEQVEGNDKAPLIAAILGCLMMRKVFQIELVSPFNFIMDLGYGEDEIADLREMYELETDYKLVLKMLDLFYSFDITADTKDGKTLASNGSRLKVTGIEALLKDFFNKERIYDLDPALVAWIVLMKRSNIPSVRQKSLIEWTKVPKLDAIQEFFQIELLSVRDLTAIVNFQLSNVTTEEGLMSIRRFIDFLYSEHKFMKVMTISDYIHDKYDLCATRAIDGSVRGIEIFRRKKRLEKFSSFFVASLDGLNRLTPSDNHLLDSMAEKFIAQSADLGFSDLQTIKAVVAPDYVADGLILPEFLLQSETEKVLLIKALGGKTYLHLPFRLEQASKVYMSMLHKIGLIQLTPGVSTLSEEIADGDLDTRLRSLINANLHDIAFELADFIFDIDCYQLRIKDVDLRPFGKSFITKDINLAVIVAIHKYLPDGEVQYSIAKVKEEVTTVPPIKERMVNIPSSNEVIATALFQPRNIRLSIWNIEMHLMTSLARVLSMRYRGMMSFFTDPVRYSYQGYLKQVLSFYIELNKAQLESLSDGKDGEVFVLNEDIERGKRMMSLLGKRLRESELYKLAKHYVSDNVYRKLSSSPNYQERKSSYSVMNFTDNLIGVIVLGLLNDEYLSLHPSFVAFFKQQTSNVLTLSTAVRM